MIEENSKPLMPPKSEMTRMYFNHLGIIFSNLSIFGLVCAVAAFFAGFFSLLITLLWLALWVMLLFATLGLVFLAIPNYLSYLTKMSDVMARLPYNTFINIVKYCLPIAIVLGILSIICLCLDKNKTHKGRIIFQSVAIGLLVVAFIVLILGVA